MHPQELKSVSQLIAERNKINAEIFSIEKNITDTNTVMLLEESLNLLYRVGEGLLERHYHESGRAFTVYTSKIRGVKNLRLSEYNYSDDYVPHIIVKVTSPAGYLLPAEINLEGKLYPIKFIESRNFEESLDY
jgi:hypothetical protein